MNLFEEAGIKLPAIKEFETPVAVAKLSNYNGWNWYVVAGDKISDDDVYCYGYVEGDFNEWGFFTLKQITSAGAMLCLTFQPTLIKNITD